MPRFVTWLWYPALCAIVLLGVALGVSPFAAIYVLLGGIYFAEFISLKRLYPPLVLILISGVSWLFAQYPDMMDRHFWGVVFWSAFVPAAIELTRYYRFQLEVGEEYSIAMLDLLLKMSGSCDDPLRTAAAAMNEVYKDEMLAVGYFDTFSRQYTWAEWEFPPGWKWLAEGGMPLNPKQTVIEKLIFREDILEKSISNGVWDEWCKADRIAAARVAASKISDVAVCARFISAAQVLVIVMGKKKGKVTWQEKNFARTFLAVCDRAHGPARESQLGAAIEINEMELMAVSAS